MNKQRPLDEGPSTGPLIGVVGPCAAGKTTLVSGLEQCGYIRVRHIAQEHSYVADMWQRLVHPDILIYLDVSYPLTRRRRNMDWTETEYQEQLHRLRHARQYADLAIDTSQLSPAEILTQVLDFLGK
jgi:deoxyadenosine/deoxycytidine kinase